MSGDSLTPAALCELLAGTGEIAVLDVRHEGLFSRSHLLQAVSAPLTRLELVIDRLVPRLATPIVVVDEAEEIAVRAQRKLRALGYSNVRVLRDGTRGWVAAGHVAFSGWNVPGKTFGELVEQELGTPAIDPLALKKKLDDGEDVVVLDSRTFREFREFSIPGAVSCPTAELVYRFHELVKSPQTLVVVNCAGRTRSIIGAQTLINAGVPNRVVSLRNSTMGWLFEGLALANGNAAFAPAPSAHALAEARERAGAMARNAGVRCITREAYARMQGEASERTLYTFDVRTPEEYLAGHLPCARSAEGGQLVQAMDEYVGTRNARIVLVDHDGVRALVVGSWLKQLGRSEVFVMDARGELQLEAGAEPVRVRREWPIDVRWIGADELQRSPTAGKTVVIDIESSLAFRDGHVPGARFATRDQLADALRSVDRELEVVITSADGVLAGLAAEELCRAGLSARALLGGTRGWSALGFPLDQAQGEFRPDEDIWYGPYSYPPELLHQHFRAYIDWELALVHGAQRDGATWLKPRNLSLGPTDLAT